jgi:uncharacterized protein involved in response to NO
MSSRRRTIPLEGEQAAGAPLLQLAFRPFFLFGSAFSLVAVMLWALIIRGDVAVPKLFGGPIWWHMHEMLFGFVAAIVVGFLLTAVQTWTGRRGLHGLLLGGLVALWLTSRLTLFAPHVVPWWLISTLDLAFLPLAALSLGHQIIRVKLWRNLMFVPILLLMALANATMHCAVYLNNPFYAFQAANAMVMLVTLVMCILGGRVFPMFTANGTQTPKVMPWPWLEKASIISVVVVVIISMGWIELPVWCYALLYGLAGVFNAIRVARWRIWVTFKTPLVWSLHVSYWCIPLGLILLALSSLGWGLTRSGALHVITVGAMGVMILAMIARVSLGHTGRIIQVGKLIAVSLLAVTLAGVVRVLGGVWIDYGIVLLISAILWCVGYGIFIGQYWSVLTQPRVDGKAG